ncbi:DHA2 family efflux MFS transporter permease subunit [Fructobacillus tropaeoli]|uniref:Putative MDR permease possible transmembrane efflux protein n=1 Tax=Fructobacillus tropaeoli TaxID=709323 RepID=A0A3F3GX45_9LACO|nr:DHA2 family efflux MFS transporter permease subunit [Fructobacillus tropaeoli]GAP03781.1 putative MDR permease possible transmembrane efflux protein [Fructobacillus tropaeoli]
MFKKYSLSLVFILGIFICMLDTTVMNVALPQISKTIHTDLDTLSWALNAYTIIFASFTIPLTRVAEFFNKKYFFFFGALLFGIGSLVSGFSTTFVILLFGRILQSFGAAILFPLSMSMGIELIPGKNRTNVIAILGVTQGLASAMGPTFGGVITEYLNWHWLFFINVPLALLIILLGALTLNDDDIIQEDLQSIDFLGSLLGIIMLSSFTSVLIEGRTWGWSSITTLAVIGLSIVSFIIFMITESKSRNPIVPLSLFKDRNFSGASLVIILSNLFLVAVTVLLPNYFVNVENLSTLNASYMITPITFSIFIASPFADFLLKKVGTRWLIFSGFMFMAIGYIFYADFNALKSVLFSCISGAFVGIGYGLITGPITVIAASDFKGAQLSNAQSVVSVLRQVGISMSVAIFVSGLYVNLSSAEKNTIKYSDNAILAMNLPSNITQKIQEQTTRSIASQNLNSKSTPNLPANSMISTQISENKKKIEKYAKNAYTFAFSNLYQKAVPFIFLGTTTILFFSRRKKY